jgi:alkaline phosphatase D
MRFLPAFLRATPFFVSALAHAAVFQGNGFMMGEVTDRSVVVWTRLTAQPEANWKGAAFLRPDVPRAESSGDFDWRLQLPPGRTLAEMEGALPGAAGSVRVTLRPEMGAAIAGEWLPADPAKDFTRQVTIGSLKPGTRYRVTVESRDQQGAAGPTLEGGFATAPAAATNARVRFTVVTCGDFARRDDAQNGHKIYRTMLGLSPDFMVHTGDVEYFDKFEPVANSPELARFKFNRIFALPFPRTFHQRVPAYFINDDHDILKNDCWPGQNFGTLTFEEGSRIFREAMPAPTGALYRTVRWGRDVQIWLVEGRQFRSPNKMPDGAEKTIWGREQKEWLFRTVAASDATFKILLTPTPIVGPDRGNKGDNHANAAFRTEGDEIRRFLGSRRDMITVNGDRHWQYESIDPQTGAHEFGCGPSSDIHAGGYTPQPGDEKIQKFFRLAGGFLSIEVQREKAEAPVMTLRHHNVNGGVEHVTVIPSAR